MDEWIASFHILTLGPVASYIAKGTLFTVIVSTVAVLLSIVIGSVLALVRNYATAPQYRLFHFLAAAYIEVFRNTPLLLWIFIGVVFCPVPEFFGHPLFGLSSVETKMLFKASIALTLFTSSVVAEIIRGGLNSGIRTCWYNPKKLPVPEGYNIDYVIADLHEIYDII